MDTTKKDKKNTTVNKDKSFDGYINVRISETKGLVEATSAEVHEIYFRMRQQGHDVEQISDGIGRTAGSFYGHNVFVSLRWLKVDGVLICFYEATSRVVDHDIVKMWIEYVFSHIGPRANNDAMNVHNTLSEAGCNRTIESIRKSIAHVESEFKWQDEQLQKSLRIKIAERELELLKQS